MYIIVLITCAMLALVLQWLVSATSDLSAYADRRIQSAVDEAVHSQVAESARDLDPREVVPILWTAGQRR